MSILLTVTDSSNKVYRGFVTEQGARRVLLGIDVPEEAVIEFVNRLGDGDKHTLDHGSMVRVTAKKHKRPTPSMWEPITRL